MPKVYSTGICIEDNQKQYIHIHEHDMPDDLFNNFKWDKINVIDIPQQHKTLWFSTEKIALEGFWAGWANRKDFDSMDVEDFMEFYKKKEEQWKQKEDTIKS